MGFLNGPDPTDDLPDTGLTEEDIREAEEIARGNIPATVDGQHAQDGLTISQRIAQNHATLRTITDANGFRPRNPTPYVADSEILDKTAVTNLMHMYKLHQEPLVMVDIYKLGFWQVQRDVRPPTVRRLYNRIKVR